MKSVTDGTEPTYPPLDPPSHHAPRSDDEPCSSSTEECAICLQETVTQPCRTPCGHLFCTLCIVRAFRYSPCGACPLCRAPVSVYDIRDVDTGTPLCRVDAKDLTIYGNTYSFKKFGRYKFETPERCYLEELSSSCERSEVRRNIFKDTSYDPKRRVFRGRLECDVSQESGYTFEEYEIHFSSDLFFIIGGHVKRFCEDVEVGHISMAEISIDQQSRFHKIPSCPSGDTIKGLIYVQENTVGLASYHFDPTNVADGSYISYEAAPPMWKLDNGDSPPAQKRFVDASYDSEARTFRGTILWSEAAFFGDVKWVYEMRFAEDFGVIEGGCVRCYDADGNNKSVHDFGVHLQYVIHGGAEREFAALLAKLGRCG